MTDEQIRASILKTIAESKRQAPAVLVREAQLRAAASDPLLSIEQFRRVLEEMIPREVLRSGPNDPGFDLTGRGWLASPLRSDFDRVVEVLLQQYRSAVANPNGLIRITGDALAAAGLTENDTGLVLCAARVLYLASTAHGTKQLTKIDLQAPLDVSQLSSIGSAADFYAYREVNPREFIQFRDRLNNTLDATTRKLIARLWSEFRDTQEWPLLNAIEVEFLDERDAFLRAVRTEFFHGGDSTGATVRVSLSLAGLMYAPDAEADRELLYRVVGGLADQYATDHAKPSLAAAEAATLLRLEHQQLMRAVRFLIGNRHVRVDHNEHRSVFSLDRRLLAARGCASLEHVVFRFDEQDQREKSIRGRTANPLGLGPLRWLGPGLGGADSDEPDDDDAPETNDEVALAADVAIQRRALVDRNVGSSVMSGESRLISMSPSVTLSEDEQVVANAVARWECEWGRAATRLQVRGVISPPPAKWPLLVVAAEELSSKGVLVRSTVEDQIVYRLTFDGWLASDKASDVKVVVSGFISAFKRKYDVDFTAAEVTYKELLQAGVPDKLNTAIVIGSTFHLWNRAKTEGQRSTFTRPVDLEEVLLLPDAEAFISYRRANPPNRVAYRMGLDREATPEVRRAAKYIYAKFNEVGKWPSAALMDVELRGLKIDLSRVVATRFVRGSDLGDGTASVSLEGLYLLPEARSDCDDLWRLLAFVGTRAHGGIGTAIIPPQDVTSKTGLSEKRLSRLANILSNQWSNFVDISGAEFTLAKSHFRAPREFQDFVDAQGYEDIIYAQYERRVDERIRNTSSVEIIQPVAQPASRPLERDTEDGEFGPWRVVRSLTGGGQGEVKVVERTRPEFIKGVLKRVRPGKAGDPQAAKRLVREAFVLRKLKHPCIADLVGSSHPNAKEPWLVTRWAPFGSLDLHQTMYLGDVERTLRLARDLAGALEAAHAEKVVHRDIKPKNVLVYSLEHVALTDFGIAHVATEEGITRTNEAPGSHWFSPADRNERKNPTPSFDVFALGRLVYFLLSGGKQFEVDHRDGHDNLVSLQQRPELEEVNKLLDLMIKKKPADRLQSMREVIATIDLVSHRFRGFRDRRACRVCLTGAYVDAGQLTFSETTQLYFNKNQNPVRMDQFEPRALICNACGDVSIQLGKLMGLAKR